ncbi:MAG: hypothetical protein L6R00_16135 [Phycisphaerae bacterium]|nr:hypothetical protein [Phycisphaerae bacterium]
MPATQSRPASLRDAGVVAAQVSLTLAERAWRVSEGRTDKPTFQERQAYLRERSDEMIQRLRESGVNLVIFPYGGFGPPQDEQDERRLAADFARRLRAAGMFVGVQLPAGRIRPEAWAAASRPADDWLVRDAAGGPIVAPLRGHFHASRVHPEYVNECLRLVEEAARNLQPDMLLLPDPSPAVGYERAAVDAFRRFVTARRELPAWADSLRQLDPTAIEPPRLDADDPVLLRCWLDFRADIVRTHVAAARERLHRAAPAALLAVEMPIRPVIPSRDIGPCFELRDVADRVDLLRDVQPVRIEVRDRVNHQIAALKALRDAGRSVIMECQRPIDAAQAMAFGRDAIGCIAWFHWGEPFADPLARVELAPQTVALARFFAAHRDLFRDVQPVTDVVLWRPPLVDAGRPPEEHPLYLQTESALVTHRVPFTVCLDPALPTLSGRQALVLAGASRLSDEQIERIERHVRTGGGLVAIGAAGTRDELGNTRRESLNDRLAAWDGRSRIGPELSCDRPTAEAPATSTAPRSRPEVSSPRRAFRVGQGRVVLLDRPGPPENVWLIARRAGVRPPGQTPPHEDDFYAALRYAAGGALSLECPLTEGGVCELTRRADGQTTILHIVNFNPRLPERPTRARVRLPPDRAATRVTRHVPADGARSDVPFTPRPDGVEFNVAACPLYDIYEIATAPRTNGR